MLYQKWLIAMVLCAFWPNIIGGDLAGAGIGSQSNSQYHTADAYTLISFKGESFFKDRPLALHKISMDLGKSTNRDVYENIALVKGVQPAELFLYTEDRRLIPRNKAWFDQALITGPELVLNAFTAKEIMLGYGPDLIVKPEDLEDITPIGAWIDSGSDGGYSSDEDSQGSDLEDSNFDSVSAAAGAGVGTESQSSSQYHTADAYTLISFHGDSFFKNKPAALFAISMNLGVSTNQDVYESVALIKGVKPEDLFIYTEDQQLIPHNSDWFNLALIKDGMLDLQAVTLGERALGEQLLGIDLDSLAKQKEQEDLELAKLRVDKDQQTLVYFKSAPAILGEPLVLHAITMNLDKATNQQLYDAIAVAKGIESKDLYLYINAIDVYIIPRNHERFNQALIKDGRVALLAVSTDDLISDYGVALLEPYELGLEN